MQARLGHGRIHCTRQIGAAERAPADMYPGRHPHGVQEAPGREGIIQDWIAESRSGSSRRGCLCSRRRG